MNSMLSTESLPLSNDWPTTTPPPAGKSASRPRSALPRTTKKKGKSSRSRMNSKEKERILKRLDVDAEQLAQQPQIMPLLRLNGIRPDRLVEVLRCDSNPESLTFARAWDGLTPSARNIVGMEAIAVSVGILPHRLWGLFAGA